jgi:hypothetical protein
VAAHLGASATVPSPHLARLHGHGRPTAQFDRASLFVSVAIYCRMNASCQYTVTMEKEEEEEEEEEEKEEE